MKQSSKHILVLILTFVLCSSLIPSAALAANSGEMIEEITIRFEQAGHTYEMTLTKVAEGVVSATENGFSWPNTIFYYPGATVTVSEDMDNTGDYTNGFFLEANHHFREDGKVTANMRYTIEEVFEKLFFILEGGDTKVEEGTGILGLGPVFLTPAPRNGQSLQTDASIFDYSKTAPANPTAPPSVWATEKITAAIAAGLVPGNLQSKYTQAATRAEFCALAAALYEVVKGAEITERAAFADTADINVQKIAGLGVVNGVGDDRFSPDAALTREQAATMLARLADAMGKPLPKQTASFADSGHISSWAKDAVGQMQATGIMGGVGNNAFAPQAPYTREQSIVTVMRLFDVVTGPANGLIPGTDYMGETTLQEIVNYAETIGYSEGKYQFYPQNEGSGYYAILLIAPASKGNRVVVNVRIGSDIPAYIVSTFGEEAFMGRRLGEVKTAEEVKELLLKYAQMG